MNNELEISLTLKQIYGYKLSRVSVLTPPGEHFYSIWNVQWTLV